MGNTVHRTFSAAVAAGRVFGVIAGIAGIVHGVGEALQGNVATGALWIESWNRGPIYQYMGGEPGISIVPNFLITGILAMITGLILIIVSIAFSGKKHWGWLIIGSSVFLLLTGGGIGPPVIGILGGSCALGRNAGANSKPLSRFQRVLATIWPYLFTVTVLVVAFIAIGSFLLVYFMAFNNADLFSNSFLASVVLLIALNFSGRAYDAKQRGCTS
jgi:hypothetical protein